MGVLSPVRSPRRYANLRRIQALDPEVGGYPLEDLGPIAMLDDDLNRRAS